MFHKGQAVKPIGTKEDLNFYMLNSDKIYHIEEFNTPEECAMKWPDKSDIMTKFFAENGGRIVVSEMPKLEWFGNRFVPVD